VVLVPCIFCILPFRKCLYSWSCLKSIGNFPLIDYGILQVVHNLDRSIILKRVYSGNDYVFDLVSSEFAFLANDSVYDLWHAAFSHRLNANMNRNSMKMDS
jgi:hypothetical protein